MQTCRPLIRQKNLLGEINDFCSSQLKTGLEKAEKEKVEWLEEDGICSIQGILPLE